MKVTNKYNLPNALVKAVERHEHRKANFSVTQLLKGATEIALETMFPYKLEMDVSDMVNMMLGTAVHKLFEEQEEVGVLNEHYMETTSFAGQTVSGTADAIDTTTRMIIDYKTCSCWKFIYKDFDDWREQIKSYLYLWWRETGELYLDGKIVAIIKDWSPTDLLRTEGYPKSPVMSISFEYTEAEIYGVGERWNNKLEEVFKKLVSQDFGCCSKDERWAKEEKWALMKKGAKKALKLYDTEEEANEAKGEDSNLYVEYRAGKDVKCDSYCVAGACGLCPYKNGKENKE